MAQIFLAVFLLVFGTNALAGGFMAPSVLGIFALIAGILLVVERFTGRVDRRP